MLWWRNKVQNNQFIAGIFVKAAFNYYCQNFVRVASYPFVQLEKSHLHLKDEQEQSIHTIYFLKDVFMIKPTGFGKSICFEVIPLVFDHKLGLVDSQRRSCIIVLSPLCGRECGQGVHCYRVKYEKRQCNFLFTRCPGMHQVEWSSGEPSCVQLCVWNCCWWSPVYYKMVRANPHV